MTKYLVLTLCVVGVLYGGLLSAAKESGGGFNFGELIELGKQAKSISGSTYSLGREIDQRDVERAQYIIEQLDRDVYDFGEDLKGYLGERYHGSIDNGVAQFSYNLDNLDGYLADGDFTRAQEEYNDLLTNWTSLGDYAAGKQIPEDYSDKGWWESMKDGLYRWWYGDEPPASHPVPESTRI